jgi:hypothetical protein
MRIKILPYFLLFVSLSFSLGFLISSCQKEISGGPGVSSNRINVEGVVTGPGGIPLQNVLIRAGSVEIMTDANGSFRVSNTQFTTAETFITASKAGYFTGSRTFFARSNSNNFLKIQLLPKTEAAAINASSGGTVPVGNATITFPANAFSNADGSAYSGTISVKAAYLDPTNPKINEQMPGDLRGLRTNGDLRGLRSFGMMNVELETAGGQKLKLKNGVTAQLSFPIPSSMSSVAGASIPLWYFDETSGLWKEEGVALKSGNRYTGNVSHFTFWNVDDPFQYVRLEMRIVSPSEQPIPGARVELTSLVDSSTTYDYTDLTGFVDGYVPINVRLRRDIYNECNALISSTEIGPFSADTDLGLVQVTSSTNQQTITGTVTNCNNLPLASGYVIISMPGNTVYANVTGGIFNITFTRCSIAASATLIAVDPATSQQGNPVTVSLANPIVAAGSLQACGTSANEFITIEVDGVSRTWNVAPFDLFAQEDPIENSGFHDLYISAFDSSSGGSTDIVLFRSIDSTTAPFSAGIQSLAIYNSLAAPSMLGDYFLDNSIPDIPMASITQYGPVGQFVTGSFSGRFI